MNELLVLFAFAGGLAAILANIGIWSPQRLWIKVGALVSLTLFLPAAYGGFTELLGRPKPMGLEWVQKSLPDAAVLGARLVEDEAIYLWLGIEGEPEPRSYVLPWIQELAQQLHKAQQEAEAEGTGVRMRLPFETALDQSERKFYAEPQQAPPAKVPPSGDGPLVHRQSSEPL